MDLSIEHPRFYFKLFYLLAFLFIYIMVIYKSLKRGYHLRSVLLMLTTISLFTVLGSRLFTIPVEDWLTVIQSEATVFNNRSSVGGLLFGLLGLVISQRVFGFNRPMLDLYAWIGPIALGIIKLGCLFNGCCYGVPTQAVWGVRYPVGTHAHFNQWSASVVQSDMAMSLPVHPVQLYETLALFLIGYLVYKTHKHWHKNFSAILSALVLFFVMRFGIEFLRDAEGSQFNTVYIMGLRGYQWSMLCYGVLAAIALVIYDRYLKIELVKGRQNSPFLHADFLYILLISLCLYTFRNVFSTYESMVVWIKFFPAIGLSAYYLYSDKRLKPYRWLTTMVLLTPFYVLAQTIPNEKPVVKQYHRIDVGGSFGDFSNEVRYNPQSGECGTTYDTEYFKQTYSIVGGGYSFITEKEKSKLTYGANVSAGSIKSSNLTLHVDESDFVFAVNPYFKVDSKWLGGGVGFQLGNLRMNKDEVIDESNIKDAQKTYVFLPEFYARVGPRKYVDLDYNYGFLYPSAFPTLYSRASIGTGFGISDDYSLRYGYISNLDTGYISAEALITKQFGINIMYIFEEDYYLPVDEKTSGKLVFSLNYRFGHKTRN
ncbi:prolipoprotein diacylglyceryl transferase [Aestuariibaculum suncheonense]|uniref:Prolipoprotein diacylglyceryl transferase n=1 Tax=Aestuariibaculum suncheonense TaxID=1028745 RepID=A0A8J6QG32_9FLAO|nr:prolipoprotein diacylglyceryl transferase family protein [Aestuariibaculum suncheonense]MBD0835467.1 prolipoprotein diacylglyceryl transferase [Aestuariibaculum suncheonense]